MAWLLSYLFVGLILLIIFAIRAHLRQDEEASDAYLSPILDLLVPGPGWAFFILIWPIILVMLLIDEQKTPPPKLKTPDEPDPAPVAKGAIGSTISDLSPSGRVRIDGIEYDAIADGEFIPRENQVRVVATDSLRLLVTRN